MHACMNVCMYSCVSACVCVCVYVCMYVSNHLYVCMYVCTHVCMYVCMYACMYVTHVCRLRDAMQCNIRMQCMYTCMAMCLCGCFFRTLSLVWFGLICFVFSVCGLAISTSDVVLPGNSSCIPDAWPAAYRWQRLLCSFAHAAAPRPTYNFARRRSSAYSVLHCDACCRQPFVTSSRSWSRSFWQTCQMARAAPLGKQPPATPPCITLCTGIQSRKMLRCRDV